MSIPKSRKGSLTGPHKLKDGTPFFKLRWYDADGERQTERVHTNRRELAQRRLDTRLREVADEVDGLRRRTDESPALTDFALRAIDERLPATQRPGQVKRTAKLIAEWWEPHFGRRPIGSIRPGEIRSIVARRRAEGQSPASCNRALSALSIVLAWGVELEIIERNPCTGRRLRQKEPHTVPNALTLAEARAVLRVADRRWRPVFGAMILAGLRLGEVQQLRWRDVDFDRDRIVVRASVEAGNAPKSGHQRAIPLHPTLRAMLEQLDRGPPAHLVFQGKRRRGAAERDPENDTIGNPRKALQRALDRAGIERRVRRHDLRATFATLVVDAPGSSLRTVQALLGHQSAVTTQRYIAAAQAQAQADAVGGIDIDHQEEQDPCP